MVKNDFIKKYFTCLSKIFFCVAFAFFLVFSFGQKDLKMTSAYQNDVTCYNDYIDLSGYSFVFNSTIEYPSNTDYDVTLSSFYIDSEPDYIFSSFTFGYFDPGEGFYVYSLYYDTQQFANGIGTTSMVFNSNEDRYITIIDGQCSSDFFQWFIDNSVITYPVISYNISINLDNGIYGQISATIDENSTLTLEYTVINNGVFSGYVFDYGQNLITNIMGDGLVSFSGNFDKVTLIISNVTSDISFTINSIAGRSLLGEWYLDYDLYLASDLKSTDVSSVLSRPFISNDITYNRIYRNTSYNSFVYENSDNLELPIVNVFSFLNGLYLPVNTYNYLLIDINYDENYFNYVPADYMFFNFFRLATNEDIARVNLLNDQLIIQKENTNFVTLFGAILDTQFNTLKSLLNFYIFDINLFSVFTFFLTLCLIFFVIKIVKGGKNNE